MFMNPYVFYTWFIHVSCLKIIDGIKIKRIHFFSFCKTAYKKATGFSIFTFDTENLDPVRDPKRLVYQHDPMSGCPPTIQNITVNKVTQGIMFTNERPPGYTSNCSGDNTMYTGIELCELKAMGTKKKMLMFQHVLCILNHDIISLDCFGFFMNRL